MRTSKYLILGGGMVAGYAAKQLVETGLKPRELTIVGSPQEFVKSGILRGFPDLLKSDVFGVGHRHALRQQ